MAPSHTYDVRYIRQIHTTVVVVVNLAIKQTKVHLTSDIITNISLFIPLSPHTAGGCASAQD